MVSSCLVEVEATCSAIKVKDIEKNRKAIIKLNLRHTVKRCVSQKSVGDRFQDIREEERRRAVIFLVFTVFDVHDLVKIPSRFYSIFLAT